MRIPQEKIDEIRDATDIVEYIGGFVKLRKRGKNYLGLCPFHQEKTPSFNVSSERQMYHCFGCGVGGNVITFIMEREKLSFIEAVRLLAERAGISLPEYRGAQENISSEQEQLFEILRAAGIFYHKALVETQEGKFALDYFHKRGFTDETIRSYGLGYSPGSWDALVLHLKELKHADELMLKSGLARRRDDGSLYDYFRSRAMFPIFSASGRLIGFGARKLKEDDPLGKYINSPETPIYNKSRVLYGISFAKEAIREAENAILVEGYADLISVAQAGVRNIVASSGTALTVEQIQLLKRYTNAITIVYDADSAGSKAALRGVDLVLENDMDVRVASLPQGDDPDSFVRKRGGDEFRKLVEGAVSFVDFLGEAFERQGKLATPEGQAHTVRTIVATIAKMRDELKRSFYVRQVAQKYKLYESTLYSELEKLLGKERNRREFASGATAPHVSAATRTAGSDARISPVERDLLYAMIDGGSEVVKFVFAAMRLEDFAHPASRALAGELLGNVEEGEEFTPSSIMSSFDDAAMQRFVADILFDKYHLSKRWESEGAPIEKSNPLRLAQDALRAWRKDVIDREIRENQEAIRTASRSGADVVKFLERHQALVREMKELDKRNL